MANQSKPTTEDPRKNDVILQWNIRGILSNYEELKKLIEDHNPLVICLQETKLEFNKLPDIRGYSKVEPNSDDTTGIGIYIKNGTPHSPVQVKSSLRVTAVKVTINNTPITLCSLHIPPDYNLVLRDLQSLFSQLSSSSKSCLMLGDYNGHSPLWGGRYVTKKGGIVEEFLTERNLCLYNDKSITYISDSNGCRSSLDLSIATPNIFLDFEWRVLSDQHGSDHFPIVLSSTSESQPTSLPRYCLPKANWPKFEEDCLTLSRDDIINSEDPMEAFTSKITSIADQAIPKTKGKGRRMRNPWYDDECDEAQTKRVNSLNDFLKHPDREALGRMKCFRAGARRTVKNSKRKSWRNFVSSINYKTQSRRIWNMIRAINGKRANNPVFHLKTNDGKTADTEEQIVETLADNYERQSSSQKHGDNFRSTKNQAEKTNLNFKSDNTENYNRIFSMKDLKKSIKKAKNSSEGGDKIHYEIIKHLPHSALEILLEIINKIWLDGSFPEIWRHAIIIPIPKPNKDHTIPSSYRPISLTSCLCKTMERIW